MLKVRKFWIVKKLQRMLLPNIAGILLNYASKFIRNILN